MIRKSLYLLAIILLIINLYLVFDYLSYASERDQIVQQKGSDTTKELRDQVIGILTKIDKEGERVANLVGKNNYSEVEIKALIKESSLSIPEIQG